MRRFWNCQSSLMMFLITAVCLPIAVADSGSLNQLSVAEEKSGWRLLFDGRTTQGWRNFKMESVSKGWQIKDGVLSRVDRGAGDIITVQQFDAFELSLEYRISKGGNSGLMFHVTEQEQKPWQTGPEIQIQDNVDGHDPQKAGWLYQLYMAREDATKPVGEWNQIRIRIAPEECVHYMNGVRYARYVKASKDWDARVAKSKFSKYKNFGKATRGHICLQDHGNLVSFRNIKIRELQPDSTVPDPIDGALSLKAVVAFPKLKWANWSAVTEQGKVQPLRPIVLTHAGDGSNRVFVATQRGVIYTFENRRDVEHSRVFLDMSSKVAYSDRQNEEGLLGVAFHPNYKDNGEFFVYYTTSQVPHTSVIGRFRVSKNDANSADANFEEEIIRVKQPYWNHNGGTIAFGPDGYLYVALGDGGAANDPNENAQNLSTLLGSVLRIDVDNKSDGKRYAIPSDNPFVNRENARGEIWAYGLRNVWRLAFDSATRDLWAGDVGQNLWEEINIIRRGGNYGWNLREATHTFGSKGVGPQSDLIEPIWEYDHEVGKSITGGFVYRGKHLPELAGAYVYADYVTGKIWALRYDHRQGKVLSNHSIPTNKMPVISFGDDQDGEIYFMVVTSDGRGIYRFERDR